ncbi:MAG: protein kinase, partial [Proteobacteria bacterium]|nr:protein kinase [Pseudomonadota bacterium]
MDSLILLWRLPRTGFILGRAGVLGHLAKIDLLPRWFCRLLGILNFLIAGSKARKDAGQALCEALQALGPGFIKFGQALATRVDLIGPELASALGQLQDRLPPFSGKKAIQIIEETSQKSVSELFADFNETAVAAASIAQVHKARLPDGRIVAVKILRPGIAHQMRRDVRFFRA